MSMQAALVFLSFIFLSLAGMPVFLSMGFMGFVGLYLMHGSLALAIQDVALITWEATSGFTLLAIPLFIFSGTLMQRTGISRDLFNLGSALVGGMRNGLGVAVILASAVFSAISGSSSATAAALGVVTLPILAEKGYPEGLRGGIACAGGTLGIMIPPSITMILFGALTETSVGKLFMAGVFPGLLLTALYSLYLFVFARPGIKGDSTEWAVKFEYFRKALWALSMPAVVLGGIYSGLATPTEIGAISCVYAMVLGSIVYRTLGFKELKAAAYDAVGATTMIMMLVGCGLTMARFLTLSHVPQALATVVEVYHVGPIEFITFLLAVYFVLGMVLEPASMMLITIPVFFPVTQVLGIDPLYFGVFIVITNELAMLTPPVGLNLYIISGIGKIPIEKIIVSCIPYLVCIIVALYICTLYTPLCLYLPQTMLK